MKRFLIEIGGKVYDIEKDFKIKVVELPSFLALEAKNIYSHEWYEETGEEYFIPDEIKYKSTKIEVRFACKVIIKSGEEGQAVRLCKAFVDKLSKAKTFSFYSEFLKQGYEEVYFTKLNDDATFHRVIVNKEKEELLQFSMEWLINRPDKNIILSI